MTQTCSALRGFLDAAHSVYHVADAIAQMLKAAGYTQLQASARWDLQPGGRYFLIRGGSALMAFRIPREEAEGFLLSASHCDRPCFKLKENLELTGAYTRAAVEGYGGMLVAPWLDRPLSIAGRVAVETEDGIAWRLLDIDRDLLLIPSVAIHMNRQVNDGYKWNLAVDTLPLAGGAGSAGKLKALLEAAAGGKLLGHDLYLYVREKASLWGVEEEFLSAPALDDLACVWGCTQGFLRGKESGSIPVLCVFDSEEVGSSSPQGAGSTFLADTLYRISQSLGRDLHQLLGQSFMVSADNAHALHPNHPELADPANAPLLGGGIVLKHNANLKYSTDGVSAALFKRICAKAEVPVQIYYNRPDIPGGSTLGHISLGQVSVPTADIGLPQLAMHSCYETAAVADVQYLEEAMAVYYGSTLTAEENGYRIG